MKKLLNIFFLLIIQLSAGAQVYSARIVYERKTNLYKLMKEDWVKEYVKDRDRIKIESFELMFNDSLSLYRPVATEEESNFDWATSKNEIYQNLMSNSVMKVKKLWGEKVFIADTVYNRQWKITDSKRTICGYTCRKAVWQPNDSTRIYAWYCDELATPAGPEGFTSLPGTILGLASEDGGIIYFAKTIEVKPQEASTLLMAKTKEKIYSPTELKSKLERDYGKYPWGKELIKSAMGYW